MRFTLAACNARFLHSCPGIFAVRNELDQRLPGCSTTLHQLTINDPFFESLLTLAASEPDAFFFSVSIWNAEYLRQLVENLTLLLPDCPIILGGPQVTFGPQDDWPDQCTIVRGEVEGLGDVFFHDLRHGKLQREYSATPAAHFPSPYQPEDFDGPLANRYIYYESSRGCPFSCSYCLSAAAAGVRVKELAAVEEELGAILTHQPKSLRFVDRTFNADRSRALAIWDFLVREAGSTHCHFEIAPDLFNEAMFAFLATVPPGLFEFEIGLQTTNPKSLTAVRRTMDLEMAAAAITKLAALDTIHLHLDLILGLPYETAASFRESFNTAFTLFPHYIQMGLLKVLPGTAMERSRHEFGLLCSHKPPYPVLATKWMDRQELSRLYWFGHCVEAFFNNRYFRTFFHHLHKVEANPFAFFTTLQDHCHATGFFGLSPTQELMSRMLCEVIELRPDQELLRELLRYDWLRCGHRFLPDSLEPEVSLREAKDQLWQRLPQNLPPFYDHASRNEFFKRTIFASFSARALAEIGLDQDGTVAFLPERLPSVHSHQRTIVIPVG